MTHYTRYPLEGNCATGDGIYDLELARAQLPILLDQIVHFLSPKLVHRSVRKTDTNHRIMGKRLATSARVFKVYDNPIVPKVLLWKSVVCSLAYKDAVAYSEWRALNVMINAVSETH